MNFFSYADERIGKKEMVLNIASVIIGVGILTFPRALAKETESFDGWMSIVITGGAASLLGWCLARLAARFPQMTFFQYASVIATKPVAYLLTLLIFVYCSLFVAFEIRAVGNIAKQYLFTTTPTEVITLAFLLVVQYAVLGTRIALLRLNFVFLPIVLFVILIVKLYTFRFFELENVRPFFATDWLTILKGSREVGLSFSGFEIILFYTVLMRRPEEAPKAVLIGLSIPIALYLLIYMFTIGVFSAEVTKNLTYPTIELAKEVEVPGGFIERVESVFFTIWIMTIFNTCAMWLDIAILNLASIFRRLQKITLIIIVSPFIYLISMLPQNLAQFLAFGDRLTYFGMVVAYLLPILLLLIAKLRGVKGNE